ncbi:MAG: VCBS repeat-containing protein [Candidatus Auribacterota bacterium]|nr:VCBS repeat-containing protein [Candidatus Auribacterota bacterium]
MINKYNLSIIFSTLLSSAFLSPILPADPLSTPTPVSCGSFFRLTDVKTMEVVHPRGTSKYSLAYQLQDTEGTIPSWGHIFDTENNFYDKQIGAGDVRLRSFIHAGNSTQAGDVIYVGYANNSWKRVYLPVMSGYTELYIGADGSTYYDEWLCQTAQVILPPTATPTLTPEDYYSPTTTPPCTVPKTPTPTPTPLYCYCCPRISTSLITLSDQTSSRDIIYDFTFNCLKQTNILHDWWTSSTDWLDVYPEQGFGFDSQTFLVSVALGDTSSLSPGPHTDWIRFDHNWGCEESYLRVDYYISTPTPSPSPEPFRLTNIEKLKVTHPRGTGKYDLVYQLRDVTGDITSWGHIFDTENRFYDKQTGEGNVLLRSFAHVGYNTQAGDDLLVSYDGGEDKHIYLPVLFGYTELYVGMDGSTYYDEQLSQLAQAALPPTPSTTPTVMGYKTPSPTPTVTATPVGYCSTTPCPCAPSVYPYSISLSEQYPFQVVTYHLMYSNGGDPSVINNWWTSSTDWLNVSPEQGFGFEPRYFSVTVSLGDTSSLSPGQHYERIIFYDDWDYNAWLNVFYNIPTPTPTPPVLILNSGDYNGDGTSEIAVFRDTVGLWALRDVSRLYFGRSGDIPVSGDYDGDGTTDVAVFRDSIGLWAIQSVSRVYLGIASDIPVPGDYDGDGYCDIGLFRRGNGLWHIPGISRLYFGGEGDIPIPGDYDGDLVDDIAVFRGGSGLWAIRDISRIYFGASNDRPVPGDYEGTGTRSPAIFRPASGLWALRGVTRIYFGGGSDLPVPADYDGDGRDSPGIFRASSGLWAIKGLSRVYFGTTGDIPVTR